GTGHDFADHDREGDDQNRFPIHHQHFRIDQQSDGDKENRAEHIAHRFDERFDAMNFPRFRDHCADDEGAERDAVAEFHREQRDAETQAQHGDNQHFVALEPRDVTDQSRHGDQSRDEYHGKKRAEFSERGADFAEAQRAGHRNAGEQRNHRDAENVFDDEYAEDQLG